MARKVFISSDMSEDERLITIGETDPKSALLWPWFLTLFDDWGRAAFIPKRIKASTFPLFDFVSISDIEAAVHAYAQQELIVRYEVEGNAYFCIPPKKWFAYQTHIRGEKRVSDEGSRHPDPDGPNTYPRPLRKGYVYLFQRDARTDEVKIGYTRDLTTRKKRLCKIFGSGDFLHTVASTDARFLERRVHRLFHMYRRQREWFALPEAVIEKLCRIQNEYEFFAEETL